MIYSKWLLQVQDSSGESRSPCFPHHLYVEQLPGDVTLTLNQHLDGPVLQSPWSTKLVFTATSFGGLGKATTKDVRVEWWD